MENNSGATETACATAADTMAHRMESLKTNAANLGIALFDSVSSKLGAAARPGQQLPADPYGWLYQRLCRESGRGLGSAADPPVPT